VKASKSRGRGAARNDRDRVRRRMLSRLRSSSSDQKSPGAPAQLNVMHQWMAAHYLYLRRQSYRPPNSGRAAPTKELDAARRVGAAWGTSVSAVRKCTLRHKEDAEWLVDHVPDAFKPNCVEGVDESPLGQFIRVFKALGDPGTEETQTKRIRREHSTIRKPR